MIKEFVFSGFGGQGVLTAGTLLANTGAINNLEVSWIPSYGSEMRGGTANCVVKIGDEEIPSPFAKRIDVLVAMNKPSLEKFAGMVRKGSGIIIVNSSVVHDIPDYDDVTVIPVPMMQITMAHENERGSNIVAVGAAVGASGIMSREMMIDGIKTYFAKYGKANDKNIAVFNEGYDLVRKELAK